MMDSSVVSHQKRPAKRLRGSCIYCGVEGAIRSREHVIPQAFGTFRNNWTLDCVCAACNSYFASELELPFCRDSVEAFHRLTLGLRDPAHASNLLNDRMRMHVAQRGFYDGARVELGATKDGSQLVPILQPQVGFRASDNDDWTWIDADKLSTETLAPYREGLFQARVVCDAKFGSPQDIVDKLATFGVPIKVQGTSLSANMTETPTSRTTRV